MTTRKTRIRKRKKLPMAVGLAEIADAAIAEHYTRPCAPRILIEKTSDGWQFACPYEAENQSRWEALLLQAFGTRSGAIMNHFLDVFTRLVGDGEWDEERHCWTPKQNDFDAMIAIVASLQPQNEAQAAYAAQLCALHLSAMKLGEQASKHYADPRTTAILSKTVRAYGDGMERLARLQGKVKPKTVLQTIQVVYCDSRTGGVSPIGGQPHAAEGSASIQCSALPSHNASGSALPLACGGGEASVPDAWWLARLWSALRRTQWKLPTRRLDE